MKRFFAAFAVTIIMLTILVSCFSENSVCIVSFTANNPDVVTIPPNAPLSVGITDVPLSMTARTGTSYSIVITGGDFLGEGVWRLTNTSTNTDYLNYTMKNIYGELVNINTEVCVLGPENQSSKLIFTISDSDASSIFNGTYSDTLTFSITAE